MSSSPSASFSSLPPSSLLPPLRRQPSSSALLAALRTLQTYDRSLLLLDPYERDLAVGWLNRVLVSDLFWLESESQGGGEEDRSSSGSAQASTSIAPPTPAFGTFEELQRFLVDESARLLEDISRSETADRGDGEDRAGGGLEDAEPMERVFCFPFDFSRPNAVLKVKGGDADGSETDIGDGAMGETGAMAQKRRFVVTLIDAPLPPSQSEGTEAPAPPNQEPSATSTSHVPASLEASSAVGVQTWAASIVLSDLLVTRPGEIHPLLHDLRPSRPLRVAELGAGTGLVGIVCAQLLSSSLAASTPSEGETHVVTLTDYHPRVLENLRRNVDANRPGLSARVELSVEALDWSLYHRTSEVECASGSAAREQISSPTVVAAGEDSQYDLLLAADVVYAPEHATWLHATMSSLLSRTGSARAHVLNARRSEGRFGEWGLVEGTDRVFGEVVQEGEELVKRGEDGKVGEEARLRVLRRVELPKVKGLGRSDERGHIWWTLGWR